MDQFATYFTDSTITKFIILTVVAGKHNKAYIAVIVTVLVAVGAAVAVFAVYRTRVRKSAHKKMPFVSICSSCSLLQQLVVYGTFFGCTFGVSISQFFFIMAAWMLFISAFQELTRTN